MGAPLLSGHLSEKKVTELRSKKATWPHLDSSHPNNRWARCLHTLSLMSTEVYPLCISLPMTMRPLGVGVTSTLTPEPAVEHASRCSSLKHTIGAQPKDTHWVLNYRTHSRYLATRHIRDALPQSTEWVLSHRAHSGCLAAGHIVGILPQSTQWLLSHGHI